MGRDRSALAGARRVGRGAIVAGAVVVVLWGAPAEAAHRKKKPPACASAFDGAQEQEAAGHLIAARDLLLECAKPGCDDVVQQHCPNLYSQLDAEMPTVVPVVTDGKGEPLADVRVMMDGELLVSRLSGQAISVDPGVHEFSFSAADLTFAPQRLLIAEGQHNRLVAASPAGAPSVRGEPTQAASEPASGTTSPSSSAAASVAPAEAAAHPSAAVALAAVPSGSPAEAAPRRRPVVAFSVTLGLGLATAAAGGLFVYWGRKDNEALAQCAPSCPPESLSHVRSMYLTGDILAGAGLVAATAATLTYLFGSAAKAPTHSATTIGIQPGRTSAMASVSGAF